MQDGPNNDYWEHVDYIVQPAASLGLRIGFLPTWGDQWKKNGGKGPRVFTPENAEIYGRFLGARYRNSPLVWILGGDKFVEDDEERHILEAMGADSAKGRAAGWNGTNALREIPAEVHVPLADGDQAGVVFARKNSLAS